MTREEKLRIEALCKAYDCSMDEFLDALENNIVCEQISIQIHFNKTGELPK
jgi:hypothetical protein